MRCDSLVQRYLLLHAGAGHRGRRRDLHRDQSVLHDEGAGASFQGGRRKVRGLRAGDCDVYSCSRQGARHPRRKPAHLQCPGTGSTRRSTIMDGSLQPRRRGLGSIPRPATSQGNHRRSTIQQRDDRPPQSRDPHASQPHRAARAGLRGASPPIPGFPHHRDARLPSPPRSLHTSAPSKPGTPPT